MTLPFQYLQAAHRLGPSIGRLAPNFNVGSSLVFAALFFGASGTSWGLSWALLCLALMTCPEPIEWDFIGSVFKSTFFGTSVKAETFMTDLLRIARELGARQGLPQGKETGIYVPFFGIQWKTGER